MRSSLVLRCAPWRRMAASRTIAATNDPQRIWRMSVVSYQFTVISFQLKASQPFGPGGSAVVVLDVGIAGKALAPTDFQHAEGVVAVHTASESNQVRGTA